MIYFFNINILALCSNIFIIFINIFLLFDIIRFYFNNSFTIENSLYLFIKRLNISKKISIHILCCNLIIKEKEFLISFQSLLEIEILISLLVVLKYVENIIYLKLILILYLKLFFVG